MDAQFGRPLLESLQSSPLLFPYSQACLWVCGPPRAPSSKFMLRAPLILPLPWLNETTFSLCKCPHLCQASMLGKGSWERRAVATQCPQHKVIPRSLSQLWLDGRIGQHSGMFPWERGPKFTMCPGPPVQPLPLPRALRPAQGPFTLAQPSASLPPTSLAPREPPSPSSP